MRSLALVSTLALAVACAAPTKSPAKSTPPRPQYTTGNGTANSIELDAMSRDGATFRFSEVTIDGNGWLVMHPFKDGKPNGKVYVGSTYLKKGKNRDVAITVEPAPDRGDKFIVMLHHDVNENQEFDFVFVDVYNVLDKAVFEGSMMIAHMIVAP